MNSSYSEDDFQGLNSGLYGLFSMSLNPMILVRNIDAESQSVPQSDRINLIPPMLRFEIGRFDGSAQDVLSRARDERQLSL
jgi:hypothetical protein